MANRTDIEELTSRALVRMRELEGRTLVIETDITHLVALIGLVQLALRHPQAAQMPTAQMTERLVLDIIEHLDPEHDALWEFLYLGFNPAFDV